MITLANARALLSLQFYTGVDGRPLRYGLYRNPENTSGKTLLFIPGLGGSIKGALGFLECLLPHYSTIYGVDLRSFGLNGYEEGEEALSHTDHLLPDLETFFQQVVQPQIDRNEIQDLTLCGISLGGVVATLMASATPERYQRLVLLAPAYKPHPKSFPLGYTIKNILAFLLKGGKGITHIPYGIHQLTRNQALHEDPAIIGNMPLRVSRGLLLGVRDLCRFARKAVRQISIPTMVVIPGQDVICDPRAMREAFQAIPNSTPKFCKEYPDFYHDVLFEEEHPEIAADILMWVSELEER
jgi:alpha-beta hydrolase superfamily lysophospholipase